MGEHAAAEAEISAQVSLLWAEDFTAKLFCNLEFWLERLPQLTGLCEMTAIVIPNSGLEPFLITTNIFSRRDAQSVKKMLAKARH